MNTIYVHTYTQYRHIYIYKQLLHIHVIFIYFIYFHIIFILHVQFRALFDEWEFIIIPVVNPDGYEVSVIYTMYVCMYAVLITCYIRIQLQIYTLQ